MRKDLISVPPADGRGGDCAAAITETTAVLASTRQLTLVSGGLLNADVAGAVVAESALLAHGNGVTWSASALLLPVILSWMAAAIFLVLAERPPAAAPGELGAAAIQHARARRAQTWAVIATAGFLLWTAVTLAIA